MKREKRNSMYQGLPMLKTIEQMSFVSGIGKDKLRSMVENGEIEYVKNGNRVLLTESAIGAWYEGNCFRPIKQQN